MKRLVILSIMLVCSLAMAAETTLKFKQGVKANLPTLQPGEPAFTTDTKEFFIGSPDGNVSIANTPDPHKLDKVVFDNRSSHIPRQKLNPTDTPEFVSTVILGSVNGYRYQLYIDEFGNLGTLQLSPDPTGETFAGNIYTDENGNVYVNAAGQIWADR